DAESDFARGRSVDRITGRLAEAAGLFNEAVGLTEIAKITLASTIETRNDAANANAETFAPGLWTQAEETFDAAARRLEAGTIESARERAAAAEVLYRDAELTAIKAQYLSQTRALLAQADQQRVPRYAPRTYARAASLLQEAEQELNNNRYDTDRPRSLAQEANYEARHALYLAEQIRAIRDGQRTEEDLVLEYEGALQQIAAAADLAARLDTGPGAVTTELSTYIEDVRERERQLLAGAEENRMQIVGLEEEIRDLDEQLGGVSQERTALVQRLEAEAAIRGQFARVESMFGRADAQVYREGNNMTLRLVGLNFESGQSSVAPEFRPLIQKVRDAAEVFPRSLIVIEGHTDSFGSDEANLALSRARAEAVGAFLTELGLPAYRVRPIGFGETQPIANNETPQGRARNRRIDVRIEPPAN
ncbi:MAG TPA: OmpA family protein, partial [Gammaproteobacteria bacterium]|nr:OmpA family protein [Gammaproteobacteria bacterium]